MIGKFKQIQKVLIYILVLNWGVALAKIVVGFMFGVYSMVADGFHSFSDGSSNIIGLVGLSAASKPTDEEHPYGHKKIESFTALGIIVLLLLVSYEIGEAAVRRFLNPTLPEANPLTFVVMIITMAVNYFVMTYEHRRGKELKSDILVSDSLHTRSDIYTSASVLISLVAIRLGYPGIDTLATFVIIGFILWAAFNIAREVFNVLVDRAVVDRKKIEQLVAAIPNVRVCHKIRTRGREDDIHMDLHLSVDKAMSVEESHKLSHQVQSEIKTKIPGVTDVIIHIEPC
jgi:cation diffusion facilitator family transporter